MYYWKNFYTYSIPNYNNTDNSEANQKLIENEFKTIENIHFMNLYKYLDQLEIFYFQKLAIQESIDLNYEIGICAYNLFKLMTHVDYYEQFIYTVFKVQHKNQYIVSLVKRILDSKVLIIPPAQNTKFIKPEKIPREKRQQIQFNLGMTFKYETKQLFDNIEIKLENNIIGLNLNTQFNLNATLKFSHNQLQYLIIVNANLGQICDNICHLYNLHTLNLFGNNIQKINPQIKHLKKLVDLDLRQNKIEIVCNELCELKNLKYLQLQENLIKYLPDKFGKLSNLKWCALFTNLLEELPDSIGNLTKLEQLAVFRNRLNTLPSSLKNCKNLSRLSAFKNRILSIPNEISQMPSLSRLSLSNNYLTKIPSFKNTTNLHFVHLQNNCFPNNFEYEKIFNDGVIIEKGIIIMRASDARKSVSIMRSIQQNYEKVPENPENPEVQE